MLQVIAPPLSCFSKHRSLHQRCSSLWTTFSEIKFKHGLGRFSSILCGDKGRSHFRDSVTRRKNQARSCICDDWPSLRAKKPRSDTYNPNVADFESTRTCTVLIFFTEAGQLQPGFSLFRCLKQYLGSSCLLKLSSFCAGSECCYGTFVNNHRARTNAVALSLPA